MDIGEDLHHDVAVGAATADDQLGERLIELGSHRLHVGLEPKGDAFEHRPVDVGSGVAAVEADQCALAERGLRRCCPVVHGEQPVGPDRHLRRFGVEQILH